MHIAWVLVVVLAGCAAPAIESYAPDVPAQAVPWGHLVASQVHGGCYCYFEQRGIYLDDGCHVVSFDVYTDFGILANATGQEVGNASLEAWLPTLSQLAGENLTSESRVGRFEARQLPASECSTAMQRLADAEAAATPVAPGNFTGSPFVDIGCSFLSLHGATHSTCGGPVGGPDWAIVRAVMDDLSTDR